MKLKIPFIVFEITPRCNLNCKYCYNIWKMPDQHPPQESTYKQALKMLRKLFSIADVPHITMSGGEPLLFSRFQEIVLFCRLKQKTVTIISNGSGKMEEYEQLHKMGITLFELPVHSSKEEEHDALAGRKGAWKNSTEAIKMLRRLGADVVAVIVITKLNYKRIAETMYFIRSLGVNQVMLNRFNIGGQGIKEKGTIGLTNKEIRRAFENASKVVTDSRMIATSNVCSPRCVINPDDYPNIPFSACYPREISGRPWTIDPEGNVRFCNHSPRIVGNIFKTSFENMIASPYIKEWQETVPEVCRDCVEYTRCWAGCRAAAEQLGLPLSCADPVVYTEMGLPLPSINSLGTAITNKTI